MRRSVVLLRTELYGYYDRRAGGSLERAGGPADGSGPVGDGRTDQPADRSTDAGADPSPEPGTQDAPAPDGGKGHDPREQEDRAQRTIAYHLIAILACVTFSLLAMMAFAVVAVDDIEKFGVIIAPIVTLVTAATSSYFANPAQLVSGWGGAALAVAELFGYAALAALVGMVVGAAEILQRYRDAPFRALFSGWGIGYVAVNEAASHGAFWVLYYWIGTQPSEAGKPTRWSAAPASAP